MQTLTIVDPNEGDLVVVESVATLTIDEAVHGTLTVTDGEQTEVLVEDTSTSVLSIVETTSTLSVVEQSVTLIVSEASPGPPGPAGSASFVGIAGQNLSAQRAVRLQDDGTFVYADNATLADAVRDVFLTTGAALTGETVTVQAFGLMAEAGWTWADSPIYLGSNGTLTQTPPTRPSAAFIRQLASPDSPDALFLNPRNPIQL